MMLRSWGKCEEFRKLMDTFSVHMTQKSYTKI